MTAQATQVSKHNVIWSSNERTTGSWWHLNWGGLAHGNGWGGRSGMVLNTSNTWFSCV